jgi:hypothetical protein
MREKCNPSSCLILGWMKEVAPPKMVERKVILDG